FATSDNREKGFDNRLAGHIGFHPQDNTEPFRAAMEAKTPPIDVKLPRFRYLGGYMVELPHPDDEAK
ncbi:MAG: NAD(P)-dependent oxidoreductase, partial [Paracoccaceae bacterium]